VLRVYPWIRHVRLAGLANLLLGVLLFQWSAALPIALHDGLLQRSLFIVGALVAVCSAIRALFPQRYMLLSAVNFVCGIWIVLSPITLKPELTWQMAVEMVAAGVALMAFALSSISESLDGRNWPC
jgi:uncharacterized membrane protein HdeD (DUF308 family)